ncbi:hypothetical protein [Micromonospora sp. NPDC001898]|uniref:NACHT N-terminal helical domain 7-containing protein n=1 Tax=Micromonospora sp. NPDC001898 TaxID=3364221 RepID=UPI0036CB313A
MGSSAMSFDAACKVLGENDAGWSARLSRLLGVAALASGGVGLAPSASVIGAAWGWIDQKNELVYQISSIVERAQNRCLGAKGRDRHELIAAAHTAVVTGAFFAALGEMIGPGYTRLRLSEAEKHQMVSSEETVGDH